MKTIQDYNGSSYPLTLAPMRHHELGLSYTRTGYGAKIPTQYKAIIAGKLRRIYCTQYSNAGSLWCVVNGQRFSLMGWTMKTLKHDTKTTLQTIPQWQAEAQLKQSKRNAKQQRLQRKTKHQRWEA